MTSRPLLIAMVCTILAAASPAAAQEQPGLRVPDGGNGVSQRAAVSQWVGLVKISIDYHSPAVHRGAKDRTGHIWGELVPFGFFDDGHGPSTATPWRAGANESTTITFSHGVTVGGAALPAGTYALFLDVERTGTSQWIFSRALGWGSYQYDPKNDVLRVPVTPEAAPYTEFLTFGFDTRHRDATVAFLQWDQQRFAMPIAVPNINELWVAEMRQELLGWPGFDAENWRAAAQFCANNKINLDEALVWADKAISEPFRGAGIGREDFQTLSTKADVLDALGRHAEAAALMDRAVAMPGTHVLLLHLYGMRLLNAGQKDAAMTVFTLNDKRHPDETYWTHVGLARGFTAVGDKARAITQWELAIKGMPLSEKSNLPAYEAALKALKTGEPGV